MSELKYVLNVHCQHIKFHIDINYFICKPLYLPRRRFIAPLQCVCVCEGATLSAQPRNRPLNRSLRIATLHVYLSSLLKLSLYLALSHFFCRGWIFAQHFNPCVSEVNHNVTYGLYIHSTAQKESQFIRIKVKGDNRFWCGGWIYIYGFEGNCLDCVDSNKLGHSFWLRCILISYSL